jgi:hypothetical protein
LESGDWNTVSEILEGLGAWSISEPCEVKRYADGSTGLSSVGDAGSLYIQRLALQDTEQMPSTNTS